MSGLNATHDVNRKSWVSSADDPDCDFPIQNLPFGVFSRDRDPVRGGVAIGDQIFDLRAAWEADLFTGAEHEAAGAALGTTLNPLLDLGPKAWSALRARLSDLLRADGPEDARRIADRVLVPQRNAIMVKPLAINAFTDFCASAHHFSRMGGRRDTSTPFFRLPVAYNGRATTLALSGAPVRRPLGLYGPPLAPEQAFGPEPSLDFEIEFGAYVATGNKLGEPVPIAEARARLFGYCLVNDWSARGIQFYESGLGPYLGKSFLTTISPWIVTTEALAPYRTEAPGRLDDEPPVPAHLIEPEDQAHGGLDIALDAYLRTGKMRETGEAPTRIVSTNLKHLYWTFAQMLTHQASNGCRVEAGELVASGTTSGPEPQMRACMVEITQRGQHALRLPNGEERTALLDGDELNIRGRARRAGYATLGFGACDGRVKAAAAWPR